VVARDGHKVRPARWVRFHARATGPRSIGEKVEALKVEMATEKDDRGGELLVDRAGGRRERRATGKEHGKQHQAMWRSPPRTILFMRCSWRLQGELLPGPFLVEVSSITVNRVIHHQAVASTRPDRGEAWFREKPGRLHEQEGAHLGPRDGDARHQGGPFPVLQDRNRIRPPAPRHSRRELSPPGWMAFDGFRGVVDLSTFHCRAALLRLKLVEHLLPRPAGTTSRHCCAFNW